MAELHTEQKKQFEFQHLKLSLSWLELMQRYRAGFWARSIPYCTVCVYARTIVAFTPYVTGSFFAVDCHAYSLNVGEKKQQLHIELEIAGLEGPWKVRIFFEDYN